MEFYWQLEDLNFSNDIFFVFNLMIKTNVMIEKFLKKSIFLKVKN